MRERVISGCHDCPYERYYGGTCEHPDAPEHEEWYASYKPPPWCPLRVEPETLRVDAGQ